MTTKFSNKIWIFGELWCPDTTRVMELLNFLKIDYEWVDSGKDEKARKLVIKTAGKYKIPVVFFPDGSYLIEPSDNEVIKKLNISSEKLSEFYRRKSCI
ncbi:MAG: glutaredoxin domain-containing protein [candidate division WOR-3 bacterium]|jgi:glutaredoxin